MYWLFFRIFFSLAYLIVRIQYVIHITHKLCVNQLFIGKASSKLSVIEFWGSQRLKADQGSGRVGVPNVQVVKGSTVFRWFSFQRRASWAGRIPLKEEVADGLGAADRSWLC